MSDIRMITKRYKALLDERLRHFFRERLKRSEHISPTAREMMEHMMEFSLRGGKRLRPILVIFGYKAVGGKKEKEILQAAIAVELMESFLLVHDDIMDQDEMRRGYLTMHRIYENKCHRYSKDLDGARYGESMAMLAGDILSIMGSEVLLKTRFPVKRKLEAVDCFNRAVINTCFGQAIDVKMALSRQVKEKEIQRLYELKTAVYTIEAPLHIGAILAGAKKRELSAMSGYAIPLGQAFQIQDDILGIYGTRQKIGKPVGSDIIEGKKTLLIAKAMEHASPSELKFLKKQLGNKRLSSRQLDKVKKIISGTGALDMCKQQATSLADEAKDSISKVKLTDEGKSFLYGLADYVVKREY